jgi:hypothetical protein
MVRVGRGATSEVDPLASPRVSGGLTARLILGGFHHEYQLEEKTA